MGRLKKEKSLSRIFRFYIVIFIISVLAEFVLLTLSFMLGVYTDLIKPANYYEAIIEKNKTEIAVSDINSVQNLIPEHCVYSVYDYDGNVLKTNKDDDFAENMWNIVSKDQISGQGYYYKVIERNNNEVCIAGYTLNTFFSNKYMNKYLPVPELTYIILFIIIFLCDVIIISKKFGKRLSAEMKILNETTNNISMESLDFDVCYSNIKEINDVLSALDKMKRQLYDSLQKQWHVEQMRDSQIGALAHDIKTPLTIIKGNSELLSEMELSIEQSMFNDGIINETATIENYLNTLLEIMNSDKSLVIQKKNIVADEFIDDIIHAASSISSNKKIKLISEVKNVPQYINIDYNMLKRSLVNIISNAVDFTHEEAVLRFSVYCNNEYIRFIIEDSGRGFTSEEIKYAKDQFFQGDKSRNSKNHYGMGLYIAQKFVENHGGTIDLSNSEDLSGAKVIINIPIN